MRARLGADAERLSDWLRGVPLTEGGRDSLTCALSPRYLDTVGESARGVPFTLGVNLRPGARRFRQLAELAHLPPTPWFGGGAYVQCSSPDGCGLILLGEGRQ